MAGWIAESSLVEGEKGCETRKKERERKMKGEKKERNKAFYFAVGVCGKLHIVSVFEISSYIRSFLSQKEEL